MGVKLMCEALDTSLDLTTSGRLVLVALAERARDETREVLPGRGGESIRQMLMRRTGLSQAGLTGALQGLKKLGCEVRVPLSTSTSGKPMYAWKGQQSTRFSIPDLPGPEMLPQSLDEDLGIVPKGGRGSTEAHTTIHPSESQSLDENPPLSLSPSEIPQPAEPEHHRPVIDALVARFGQQLDRETAARAVAFAESNPKVRSVGAYLSRFDLASIYDCASNGSTGAASTGPKLAQCKHGQTSGMEVKGRGDDASRICGLCEIQSPAVPVTSCEERSA